MTHKAFKNASGYADLADMSEDERIRMMGHYVLEHDVTASVVTDDEPGKVERYMQKMAEWFPMIEICEQGDGPVAKSVYFKIRKRGN